ncbi:class I SAM-dependent methyltransferase [Amycolatopsis pithecellobii]|uniref:Methyltransferase domain-containing protein n=1 Tax=Amycolatopsis pithecellobii TaxID=664692 RepID=A0A6N7Z1F3_9PSEU|nr:methyltransferase domain-containing protein [Amycolatopsis pithecellobii]MTD53681.1 methyltransferase domain-containing protein [Amycolatopsis pithecellobii]
MSIDYAHVSETRGKADPWSFLRDRDIERMGEVLRDPAERERWAMAFLVGGGLPYMWTRLAANIQDIAYALLDLRPGDRVLIVGEEVESCGWRGAVEEAVGPAGTVDVAELIDEGNAAIFEGKYGRNGLLAAWQWTYTHDTPDETYDAILVAQAAQHCDDWSEASEEFVRVLKPGKRIVSAEALIPGGGGLTRSVDVDIHVQTWFDKLVGPLKVALSELGAYTAEEIKDAFGDRVEGARAMEWRGVHVFWGRKPLRPGSSTAVGD